MKTIDKTNFANKKVLIRVDFNVPLDGNKSVTDNTRIIAAKPTIDKVLADGGSCVLMSHLGRPKGIRDPELSLTPIYKYLKDKLKTNVFFLEDLLTTKLKKSFPT